ncbi:hypothetical protein CcCBS67573_g00016 [Chytriomyces confervae]|uniref:Urea active transporter n=1 Tax=Chytriomyces confervae TaxID=246404 RepID=A0A507FQF9_9FUNG|nr:hypothetical protein CcCBS67573_g00016 [Chytriomyces confervae]
MSANFSTSAAVFTGTTATVGITLSFATYVAFGAAALAYALMAKNRALNVSADFFITARNSANLWTITWSWFASAMGSWILYTCAFISPGANFGINGLLIMALFTGLPLPIVAHMGDYVRKRVPTASSVTSYARWRFGKIVQVLMMLQILQILFLTLISEYTTIGGIFAIFFDIPPYIPVIVCGFTVMVYTAVGGFYISIITDIWQSILAISMITISFIYLCISYKGENLGPLPDYLGVTVEGWAAFATIGIPYVSLTFFNEGFWQRVWAAENSRIGKTGAWIACAMLTVVTFILGFGGTMAYWSGRATEESNPNLAFFLGFANKSDGTASAAITIFVIMFAVAMNEAAVDTIQNAVTDTITNVGSVFNKDVPLWAVRAIVVVVQVPLIVAAAYCAANNVNILNIFLFGNMMATIMFVPIASGLFESLHRVVSTFSVMMAILCTLISVLGLSVSKYGTLQDGFIAYFWSAYYQWEPFVMAPCVAVLYLAFWSCVDLGVRRLMKWEAPNLPLESRAKAEATHMVTSDGEGALAQVASGDFKTAP